MKYLSSISTIFIALLFTINCTAQSRSIGNFSTIQVSASVSVKLVKADAPNIEYKMIKGSDSDLITEIKGKNLIVKMKSNLWGSNKSQAKVIVYYTELTDISVTSGASLKTEEAIHAKDFDIDVSGGANANIEVISENIDVEASSGANLKLKGQSKKGNYDASTGSNINAKLMICDYVDADVLSGANIQAHVNKKLNADASSGGTIRYTGDADDNKIDKGWSGQISRM